MNIEYRDLVTGYLIGVYRGTLDINTIKKFSQITNSIMDDFQNQLSYSEVINPTDKSMQILHQLIAKRLPEIDWIK